MTIILPIKPFLEKSKSLAIVFTMVINLLTNPLKAQVYCETNLYTSGCTSNDIISYFELNSLINNSGSICTSTVAPYIGFSNFTSITTTTLTAGQSYQTVIGTIYGSAGVNIWIDYDNDGNFILSEQIGSASNLPASSNYTTTVNIPANANPGVHRLRARLVYGMSGNTIDPCTQYSFGECEDYNVYIQPLPACSGTPFAGNATTTSTLVCGNTSFNLNLSGNTVGSGITYQWQSSPNGNTWTNFGPIQNNGLLSINSITATTYYQCIATCSVSGQSAPSSPVIVNLNSFINCYCVPQMINCSNTAITNVTFQTINHTPLCTGIGYVNYADTVPAVSLVANQTYSIALSISCLSGTGIPEVWIDYNHNGIFESNEYTPIGGISNGTVIGNISVPFTALGGNTRMRIKMQSTTNSTYSQAPCLATEFYGQFLDYLVTITPATPCAGAPNSGNANSTASSVCKNFSFTLNLAGNDIASNINYQWQSSVDNVNWINIGSSQTSIPYTISSQSVTTYYRCITTCASSALSGTSTPVMVSQKLPTACYCAPGPINCASSYFTNIIFGTINNNPTCVTGGYIDNSGVISPVALNASQNYTISTNIFCQSGTGHVGVWVDFNQDGMFDSYEYNDIGSIASGSLTGNIYVPFTALAGYTKMRLKMESTLGTFQGFNPCTSGQPDGETIDYDVIITPEVPCNGTPNAGNADAPSTAICDNTPFDLNLLNNDVVSNISYQWQSSPDNVNWTNIGAPQTTVPFYISTQTVTTHYRCVTTCTTSALSATSTPIAIIQNPLTACYCIPPASYCSNGDQINNVVFAALSNTSTCSVNGYENYSTSVPSTTITAGQTYTIAVTVGSDYFGKVTAWIDYDQNGVFDASEYTNLGVTNSAGNYTVTNTISIPANALAGNTKIRIRNNNAFTFLPDGACVSGAMPLKSTVGGPGSGETEDYLLTILPPDCGSVNFPSFVSATGPPVICVGQTAALGLATAMPFATGITYQWMSSTGGAFGNEGLLSSVSNINVNPSSTSYYYCNIMCNGNPVLRSDTIAVSIDIVSASVTGSNATCFGICNGSATVTAISGAGGYSYSWSPTPASTPIVSGLCAGAYSVTVMDLNGCSTVKTISITEPAAILATPSQTNVSCYGFSDGMASVSVVGGTAPLSYSWSPAVGVGSNATNLAPGNYSIFIMDANNCSTNQTITITQPAMFSASIIGSNSSICEQLEDTLKSNLTGGVTPFSYSWTKLPSTVVSTSATYDYTTSVGTFSYNLLVTDATNCSAVSNTLNITVNPSSNFSGMVTTNPSVPVAGVVVLYKYLPFYTKFDSVAGQTIAANGSFLFNSFTAGTYIIKAIPTATNMQIAYGDSAVNWKTAKQIIHGCAVNDVQNINVKALSTFTTPGTGLLSGRITEGYGFGLRMGSVFKPTVPGTPIGGIVVKGGKNPGGQMFVQTITDPTSGTYTLSGLPDNIGNESYFVLVDIPGLDTNNTYHKVISLSNNQYTNLDFIVDSAKINPINAVSVHDITSKEHSIKVFPNPASNYVTIQYDLQNSSQVKIELYDILGKSVKTLLPATEQGINTYKNSWSLDDLKAGMYFIKININGGESTIKLSVSN